MLTFSPEMKSLRSFSLSPLSAESMRGLFTAFATLNDETCELFFLPNRFSMTSDCPSTIETVVKSEFSFSLSFSSLYCTAYKRSSQLRSDN